MKISSLFKIKNLTRFNIFLKFPKTFSLCQNSIDCEPFDDFVVDIGDIAHIGNVVAGRLQPTIDDVERHHHARMPDMAIIVNGHSADVHSDATGIYRGKDLLFTRQRVVYFENAHGRLSEFGEIFVVSWHRIASGAKATDANRDCATNYDLADSDSDSLLEFRAYVKDLSNPRRQKVSGKK